MKSFILYQTFIIRAVLCTTNTYVEIQVKYFDFILTRSLHSVCDKYCSILIKYKLSYLIILVHATSFWCPDFFYFFFLNCVELQINFLDVNQSNKDILEKGKRERKQKERKQRLIWLGYSVSNNKEMCYCFIQVAFAHIHWHPSCGSVLLLQV